MRIELTDNGTGLDLTKPPYDTEGLGVVVLGNKGAGKSNILAVIAEEAHRNMVPFIYFDPNGDAASLKELGEDVIVIGDPEHDEAVRRADYPLSVALRDKRDLIRMVLKEGFSLVIDLTEGEDPDLPHLVFQGLINEHYRQAGRLRTPCFVIVDEAQNFAPEGGADDLEKGSLRSLSKIAFDGRKRGMLLVVATLRATYLSKKIIFGANVRIFGKLTWLADYKIVQNYVPASFRQMMTLRSGHVFIMSDNGFGMERIRRRNTTDLGKTPAFKQVKRRSRPSKIQQLRLPIDSEAL